MFQVESPMCASVLKTLDKQLTLSPSDPFVLRIRVVPSPPPQMIINEQAIGNLSFQLVIPKDLDFKEYLLLNETEEN
jgi:hypothetical protein